MERLTPLDIFNKDFKYSFRGYNVDEVNEFLDLVIKNFEALIEENRQLKQQVQALQHPVEDEYSHEYSDPVIRDILRRLERLERMSGN